MERFGYLKVEASKIKARIVRSESFQHTHKFSLFLRNEGSHHPSGWSKVPLLQERDLG